MKLKTRIVNYIIANQRVFSHDRTKSVGASEIFRCLRQSGLAKFRPELAKPIDNWGVLERGNVVENKFLVPALQGIFGFDNCLMMGSDQESLVSGYNSATTDGLIQTDDLHLFADDGIPDLESDCLVCEMKSFDPNTDLYQEKTVHKGQLITQLSLIRELTPYKPVWGVVIYINASDFGDVRVFPVRYDDKVYAVAQKRATEIFTTKDPMTLRAEGVYTDQCNLCRFVKACKDARNAGFPEAGELIEDGPTMDKLAALAVEHKKLSVIAKKATEEVGSIAETIREELMRSNSRKAKRGKISINLSMSKGRMSKDNEAVDKYIIDHGDDPDDFKKEGSPYTRLTVHVKT